MILLPDVFCRHAKIISMPLRILYAPAIYADLHCIFSLITRYDARARCIPALRAIAAMSERHATPPPFSPPALDALTRYATGYAL